MGKQNIVYINNAIFSATKKSSDICYSDELENIMPYEISDTEKINVKFHLWVTSHVKFIETEIRSYQAGRRDMNKILVWKEEKFGR